jgi:hypothetical protein
MKPADVSKSLEENNWPKADKFFKTIGYTATMHHPRIFFFSN